MRRWEGRRGGAAGTVLLALSVLSVAAALAYPWLTAARFRGRVADAVSDVDALEAAARRYQGLRGAWPADGETGVAPVELRPFLPDDADLVRADYRLRWSRWETVAPPAPVSAPRGPESPNEPVPADSLPAPRPRFHTVVGVTVESADAPLLAALAEHYRARPSFVRDSSWTLILTPR